MCGGDGACCAKLTEPVVSQTPDQVMASTPMTARQLVDALPI
jgi:hypothetical protein